MGEMNLVVMNWVVTVAPNWELMVVAVVSEGWHNRPGSGKRRPAPPALPVCCA